MKKSGLFFKVFIFTVLFSILLVGVTAALLWTQISSYHSRVQMQGITSAFQSIIIQSKGNADISEIARQFSDKNQSMQFYIKDRDGRIVYATPEADKSGIEIGEGPYRESIMLRLDNDYLLHVLKDDLFTPDYDKWIGQAVIVLFAMFAVCVISAFVFARQITKPIKTLANATSKMASLEEVQQPPERKDELGALSRDVYSMYNRLKETISRLEIEILREREIEETQRYFFSAASHELKTPIAATSVLLEGMIENAGAYKDHPKYLRECVKMMDAQGKMISEILEIVNLNDGKIAPAIKEVDVRRTVARILPDFQTLAEANSQRIATDIPEGQTCLADSQMLRKAISNILLNAVQNTPEGGKIRIWSAPAAGGYRLSVLNSGASIDEAVLPKLYDPFYREDNARSRKSGRSGLGLTIVRKTLESMNINFALENTTDGVLFWMDLPKA